MQRWLLLLSYLSAALRRGRAPLSLSLSLYLYSFYFISLLTVIYTDKVITDSPRGLTEIALKSATVLLALSQKMLTMILVNVEIMCWSSRLMGRMGKWKRGERETLTALRFVVS